MKDLENIKFDVKECIKQLNEFKNLLDSKEELAEGKDILPFFKQNNHLSAYIASFNPNIAEYDRIAYEFDVWGDFKTDLSVGDSKSRAFCFIEFENAEKDSVFKTAGKKTTTDWSPRFEHGFSQIVDWFYKLEDQRSTRDFRAKFGGEDVTYIGILVVGRSRFVNEKDKSRLNWRSDKMIINSVPILCLTYDELYEKLDSRLKLFKAVYELEK